MERCRLLQRLFGVVATLFLVVGIAQAQSQFGTVVGSVTDPSQARVAEVTVKATNEATATGFSTVTSGSGDYLISGLLPGTYTLSATKAGFKDTSLKGVVVLAGGTARADIELKLGATTETVTVSASAAQLNTETAAVTIASPTQYVDKGAAFMPINQMLSDTLVMYLPGTTYQGARQVSAYGSRTYDRRITLDGVIIGSNVGMRLPRGSSDTLQVAVLNADATHQTANSTEELTAKGTNGFHGSIWTEFANNAFWAEGILVPGGTPRVPGTPSIGYGYVLGGPVYIPKVYDGRNKTFFMTTFQRQGFNLPSQGSIPVPTDAMRGIGTTNGGYDLTGLGIEGGICDPSVARLADGSCVQTFANNIIPANRVSQVAKNILTQYYPTGVAGPYGRTDYVQRGDPILQPLWDVFARVDHQFGSKDNISGSYVKNHSVYSYDAGAGVAGGVATTGLWVQNQGLNFINVSENHIFSPRLLNEANFGIRAGPAKTAADRSVLNTVLTNMGLPLTPGAAAGLFGGPTITVSGMAPVEWGGQSTTNQRDTDFRDVLSFVSGRYTTKVGVEVIRESAPSTNYGGVGGTYNFDGTFTGAGYGDFLLGLPVTTGRNLPSATIGQTSQQTGFFFNENIRATSKLTLDMGVRFEILSPIYDPGGRYNNFDLKTGDLVVPSQASIGLLNPGLSPATLSYIVTANAAGFPSKLINTMKSFDPRLGLAYHLRKDTVLRAAYGIYGTLKNAGGLAASSVSFDLLGANNGIFTAGVQNFTNTVGCASAVPSTCATLSNPFPSTTVAGTSGLSASGINPNLATPVTHQWNATVEQRLPGDIVFRVSYVGSRSMHLGYTRDVNLPMASTIPLTTARLVYPQWKDVTYTDSGGNASYNALDTEFKRRFSRGITLSGGYAWQKCLTDDDEGGLESNYGSWGIGGLTIENPYNRSRDKGNCEMTVRHIFKTMYVWDLPVGQGRHFLAHPSTIGQKVAEQIFGGWTWSGFFIAQTGDWFTPYYTGFDAANTGQTLIRPDRVCNGNASQQTYLYAFDSTCFTKPASGSYGNAGKGIIQGLGYWNYDAGLYKIIHFSNNERWPKLRITANASNAFNHSAWQTNAAAAFTVNNPAGVVGVGDSGVYSSGITANLGAMRIIRMEARVEW